MKNFISEIQIVPIRPKDGLVGFASFVYNNAFYFNCIGIMTRPQGGYRLTYPNRKTLNGKTDFFYPIDKEVALSIETEVIKKYEDITGDIFSGNF